MESLELAKQGRSSMPVLKERCSYCESFQNQNEENFVKHFLFSAANNKSTDWVSHREKKICLDHDSGSSLRDHIRPWRSPEVVHGIKQEA